MPYYYVHVILLLLSDRGALELPDTLNKSKTIVSSPSYRLLLVSSLFLICKSIVRTNCKFLTRENYLLPFFSEQWSFQVIFMGLILRDIFYRFYGIFNILDVLF